MSWGSNWGFGTTSQQQASDFLSSGNYAGYNSSGSCTSSSQCASGYTCSGGWCVPRLEQQSSDGTTGGCGSGEGGGGCNADVTVTQGMTAQDAANRGYSWSGGVGTKTFEWVPIYSADGCTIAGCSLRECGSENAQDCPGARQCRYDAFGNIRCYCGEPQQQGCSAFCTSYQQSYGDTADGCSGLACDECSFCEEYNVWATGACKPSASGPCHCQNVQLDACEVCNEDGTTGVDTVNCGKCVEISNYDCGFVNPETGGRVGVNATCCYSLQEWDATGPSPVNKCQDAAQAKCNQLYKDYYGSGDQDNPSNGGDPCVGTCTSERVLGSGPCPDPPVDPDVADGHKSYWSGCIEANGQHYTLYYDCDLTNVPDKCKQCDCNCHNDCPDCQLCGADGKCYPDPACAVSPTTVTVTVQSQRTDRTFDCIDCSGTLLSVSLDEPITTTTVLSYSDWQTRTINCSIINDDCETACQWRTAGGKVWSTGGYGVVTNCNNAGPDASSFTCPSNVNTPCNAYNRPDLRYYSDSWRLYQEPNYAFS